MRLNEHIEFVRGICCAMSRAAFWTTAFSSMQWLLFIFANTVVVPISVGTAFGLPAEEIAGILRSSLVFTGLACVLQGLIGHRFPLMEGHSGVMWGLTLNLCASASAMSVRHRRGDCSRNAACRRAGRRPGRVQPSDVHAQNLHADGDDGFFIFADVPAQPDFL
jgi:hypothetical protein